MGEWMHQTDGEASYRQQTQRAMRQAPRTPGRDNTGRRMRAALATALVTLAARLDATATRAKRQDTALSPANPA